ncbi:MAG: hypothetical protein JW723_00790 [Bacteroidales bacterium]|nr:hypothetical protein [Bacteroidales bacterium]
MNFDYDVFISYGSSEDTADETVHQWAVQFCDYLALLLNRLNERELTFMLHDDLRSRKQLLGTERPVVLTKTAVFVTIISPDYTGSESYQNELQEVYNAVYKETDDSKRSVNRIFKVLTAPIPGEQQPACLINEIEYAFYEINRYSKKSRTFDVIEGEHPEEKFWFKLIDLVYDIQNSLELLSDEDAQKSQSKKYVYLAETSFDQSDNRDEIRRELQYLGYNILPLISLPNDGEKIEALIKNYIDKSVISIHLMGAFYGDMIKKSKYSLIDLQNRLVREYVENSNTEQNRLIWIPSDLKITDQRQSLYLNRLKRDESKENTEIIEAPIEVFKTVLKSKLREIDKPERKKSGNKKVYLVCENQNKSELSGIYRIFSENNLDIIEQDFDTQKAGLITTHKQNLIEADAVLIYHGNSSKLWLNSKVQDLVKAPGFGKEKPFLGIGIISRDNIDDNIGRFLQEERVIKSDKLDEAFSRSFVNQLIREQNVR